MPGRLPDYLVIGAMKAGSTSLATYLGAHPQAFLAPNKEVYFFERDANWAKGVEWYREKFADAGPVKIVGEASPSYMFTPAAPERIAKVLPTAKLVAILRNPVDRAYSHYWHQRFRGKEHLSFRDAIVQEGQRGAPGQHWDPQYVARGRYMEQLDRVLEHFSLRNNSHVVLLDDLRADPVATFSTLCRFLDIDDSIVPDTVGQQMNPHSEVRFPRIWYVMFKYHLWRRLPPTVASHVGKAMLKKQSYEPLDDATRRELNELYRPSNAELGRWLGRDLVSLWSAPPAGPRAGTGTTSAR